MVNKNTSLPPLDYLLAFEAAAELGSFAQASRTLNISESSVSRKVKLLEHHYGRSFFKRAERSVALTKHGHQFFKDIAPILDELRVISNRVQVENAVQTVTLAATHSVAGLWLMPRLARFNALNDDLKIKLLSSDNDEECLGEDVTLSILRGDGHWQGYDARLLFGETIFPVCSPQYLEKNPDIANIDNLARFSLIGVDSKHTEWMNWPTWLTIMQKRKAHVDQAVLLNTYPLSIDAAVSGLGLALGWGHLVDHLIEDGKLVRPLQSASVRTEFGYYLLKPSQVSGFKERDQVENWLIDVSEKRRRYSNS